MADPVNPFDPNTQPMAYAAWNAQHGAGGSAPAAGATQSNTLRSGAGMFYSSAAPPPQTQPQAPPPSNNTRTNTNTGTFTNNTTARAPFDPFESAKARYDANVAKGGANPTDPDYAWQRDLAQRGFVNIPGTDKWVNPQTQQEYTRQISSIPGREDLFEKNTYGANRADWQTAVNLARAAGTTVPDVVNNQLSLPPGHAGFLSNDRTLQYNPDMQRLDIRPDARSFQGRQLNASDAVRNMSLYLPDNYNPYGQNQAQHLDQLRGGIDFGNGTSLYPVTSQTAEQRGPNGTPGLGFDVNQTMMTYGYHPTSDLAANAAIADRIVNSRNDIINAGGTPEQAWQQLAAHGTTDLRDWADQQYGRGGNTVSEANGVLQNVSYSPEDRSFTFGGGAGGEGEFYHFASGGDVTAPGGTPYNSSGTPTNTGPSPASSPNYLPNTLPLPTLSAPGGGAAQSVYGQENFTRPPTSQPQYNLVQVTAGAPPVVMPNANYQGSGGGGFSGATSTPLAPVAVPTVTPNSPININTDQYAAARAAALQGHATYDYRRQMAGLPAQQGVTTNQLTANMPQLAPGQFWQTPDYGAQIRDLQNQYNSYGTPGDLATINSAIAALENNLQAGTQLGTDVLGNVPGAYNVATGEALGLPLTSLQRVALQTQLENLRSQQYNARIQQGLGQQIQNIRSLAGFASGGDVQAGPYKVMPSANQQMVTPEPITGVGQNTGTPYFQIGEAGPELASIGPNNLHVNPLEGNMGMSPGSTQPGMTPPPGMGGSASGPLTGGMAAPQPPPQSSIDPKEFTFLFSRNPMAATGLAQLDMATMLGRTPPSSQLEMTLGSIEAIPDNGVRQRALSSYGAIINKMNMGRPVPPNLSQPSTPVDPAQLAAVTKFADDAAMMKKA